MNENSLILSKAELNTKRKITHTPSVIQADTLFTFMTELRYLLSILENRMISPRYNDETINLQITIYLDEKNHTMKLNISFDLSKAMTVRDIVQVTSIYNAYLAGKGTMFNKPLEGQLEGNDLKCYDENSLTF